ncbi:MAG: cystathionine gamma-synthase [Candidatus Paceibacterota bacterium]
MSEENQSNEYNFETNVIHGSNESQNENGAVVAPIYLASTFKQEGVGNLKNGFEYSRSGNPTREKLETALAVIEKGYKAFTFASGLAAEDVLLRTLLSPGDEVVIGPDAYGGTFRLLDKVYRKWGVKTVSSTGFKATDFREAITDKTKIVWVETPTNPMLKIVDIEELSKICKEYNVLLVVDNTFASPYIQKPLSLGADFVVHSTTKYIGGHSDVVGGAVIVKDGKYADQLAYNQNAIGSVQSPFDCYLVLRGLKTLSVRMERHCSNAEKISEFLKKHPAVLEVIYPGDPNHPDHEIAKKQMKVFGGMISFRVKEGHEKALNIVSKTKIITLAESLGGVESLIEVPHAMTHASVQGTKLEVPKDLIRLSVGIEDVNDLLNDLRQALE